MPHEIDPFRLCESGARLAGDIPLSQLKRLEPLLSEQAEDSERVNVVLNFDIDELGVPYVHGEIRAHLVLICQRCLEALDFPVHQTINLAWAKNEKEMKNLPLRLEPYLVEAIPLATNDVIEDELIMAIPQIPMHKPAECGAMQWINQEPEQDTEHEPKENPFAVLSSLKTKD